LADPDLVLIVSAWAALPEPVRSALVTLVKAART